MWRALSLLLFSLSGACAVTVLYQWDQLDFEFPSPKVRNQWIHSGAFQPKNALPLDADISQFDPKSRLFVTVPRFRKGIPTTLGTVVPGKDNKHAVLRPYPSPKFTDCSDCRNLCSVLRIKTTNCGHLWVLDSGVDDILGKYESKCPPKIVIYDLRTDAKIWQYEIPKKDLKSDSLLGTIEVQGNCSHAYAYLADIVGHGIVVVDAWREQSWRVQNSFMDTDPASRHFSIGGQNFDLDDGVISLVLARNALYFHSLASRKEVLVPSWILRDPHNFQRPDDSIQYFYASTGERLGQSGPSAAAAGESVILYSDLPRNSLYCWKVGTTYGPDHLYQVYNNNVTFQFASGLKVVKDIKGREWMLAVTSRFQNYMNNVILPNEVNYRLLTAPVDELLAGSPCVPHPRYPHFN